MWGRMAMSFPEHLHVGTSSWMKDDWIGPLYSPHLNRGQFIEPYARRFNTIEIDATYCSIPTPQMVTIGD
jgi:uncharacterized protein YecE (DUF72 family)